MSGIMLSLLARAIGGGGPYTVIQTFTSSTTWICPAGVTEVEYLVVAGGGGGGSNSGGGGGAGGFRTGTAAAVTTGTSYTITVGSGGAGAIVTGVLADGLRYRPAQYRSSRTF